MMKSITILKRAHQSAIFHTSRGLETLSGASFMSMDSEGKRKIAYRKLSGPEQTTKPGLIYIHGFQSNMDGAKGKFLERLALDAGISFVRFDQEGTRAEDKNLGEVRFSHWIENTLAVIDRLTEGPQVIVGSSLGGWLGIWGAIHRPERIKGLVFVAPAINFLTYYYNQFYSHCPEDAKKMLDSGATYTVPTKYGPITMNKQVTESSIEYELDLDKPISVKCPIRILHGMKDDAVPYKQSLKLLDAFESTDVDIIYRKFGLHQLSHQEDLVLLGEVITNTFLKVG